MPDFKLRQAIAFEAARLMYERSEKEYFTAKIKAAKRICKGYVKPSELPSNSEIRDLIQQFARTYEGERRTERLKEMRLHALRMMKLLCRFRPRIIGSVFTGHIRKGSDIDLHVFTDHHEAITNTLESEHHQYTIEHKQISKDGEDRIFTHIHVFDTYEFELTVYAENLSHYLFKSSITGKAIERASIAEFEQFLQGEYPGIQLENELADQAEEVDPYPIFRMLLLPLDQAKQSPKWHPEGDVLYHSLQVFEQAKDRSSYDEEFLLAALLHDIGKGIDPYDHVNAGLQALEGLITPRTSWLIEHHMIAHEYVKGTLGSRQRRRLEDHQDFEDLLMLQECDMAGRVPGAWVGTVDEALNHIKDIEQQNRWK